MTVKEFSVKGTKVEITVQSDGIFRARVHGDWLEADTLKAVEALARKAAGKASIKVAVPFTLLGVVLHKSTYRGSSWISGVGVRHGVATGIHSKNDTILVKWEDGDTEQIRSYARYENTVVRRITDAEVETWTALRTALNNAEADYREFMRTIEPEESLSERVIAAQKAAVDDPHEVEQIDDDDPR